MRSRVGDNTLFLSLSHRLSLCFSLARSRSHSGVTLWGYSRSHSEVLSRSRSHSGVTLSLSLSLSFYRISGLTIGGRIRRGGVTE